MLKRRSHGRVKVMAAELARVSTFGFHTIPARRALKGWAGKALSETNIKKVLQTGFIVGKLFEKSEGRQWLRHHET